MNQQSKSHTAMIVLCVTWLGSLAALGGAWLLWKGFTGGSELVLALNSAISGLIGFLGGRAMTSNATQPDITISSQPPRVEVTQPQPEKKD